MTTAAFIVGYLCGLVLVCMFIWIMVALRMAYTQMDEMLEHLKNSPSVMTLVSLRCTGPWGKLMLIGGVSGFVTFPHGYIKRGCISAEDIDNFPTSLKLKLAILQWSIIALFGTMVIFVVLYKIIKAYHF
jgi:flagellar biosynthesis protein FliQ